MKQKPIQFYRAVSIIIVRIYILYTIEVCVDVADQMKYMQASDIFFYALLIAYTDSNGFFFLLTR